MFFNVAKQFGRSNVLTLGIYLTFAAAQNITIYRHQQCDSVTTCETGLRKGMDRFVFKTDVDFKNASLDWLRVAGFEYQPTSSNDFILFCLVDLRSMCSGNDGSKCYCNYTDTNGVHHIVINATAQASFSNSSLRGYLSYKYNPTIFSTPQKIPIIYDTTATSRRLTVNDVDLQNGVCLLNITHANHQIKFCCTMTATPCVASVSLNGQKLVNGTTCVVHTVTEATENSNVTFSFFHSVCGVDDPTEYPCTVYLEKAICKTHCGWEGILLISCYAVVMVSSIIVGIVLLVYILKKRSELSVIALTCIHVSTLTIEIAIIIIQSLLHPCKCDPDGTTISISICKIFLIVYFSIFFIFIIAVALALLYLFYQSKDSFSKCCKSLIICVLDFTIVVPFIIICFRCGKRNKSGPTE